MIEYYKNDQVPDRIYFRCEQMRASLSTTSCAARWRDESANTESVSCCRRCPLGALHAGETAASLSPFRGAKVCARCHRGTMRLVEKHLCVSCWNREREIKIGKNAKGSVPVKLGALLPRRITVVEGGHRRLFQRAMTYATAELFVAALRDCRHVVTFAFDGEPQAQYSQLRLF